MYSSTTCTTCIGLGKWLNQNGFQYTKKMIDSSPEIMEQFLAVSDGYIGVPFTIITTEDGQTAKIPGYDRKAFKRVLSL
jgi:glutaredoxin-related protein